MASLTPGTILQGRYRIVASHDAGGSAVIYSAQRVGLEDGVQLAIKEVDPNVLDYSEFQNEARLLYSLSHPNIPKVYDFFVEDGKYYLVMEFIEGTSLEALITDRGQGLNSRDALNYALQICDAFSYLHGLPHKVIHRDLKPANLMLTKSGVVKLIDFGIARTYKPNQKSDTLYAYSAFTASPEQKANLATDERSDIYSFGATLYCLVMGEPPPQSITESSDGRDPAINALERRLPGLGRVVWKCMRYEPSDRYQSFEQVKEEVAELLKGSKRRARMTKLVALVALSVAGLLIVGLGLWGKSRGIAPPAIVSPATGTVQGPTRIEAGQGFSLALQGLDLPDNQISWLVRDVLQPSSSVVNGVGRTFSFSLKTPGIYEASAFDMSSGRRLADAFRIEVFPSIQGPDQVLIGHEYEISSGVPLDSAKDYSWRWLITAPSGAKSERQTSVSRLAIAFTEVGSYRVSAVLTVRKGEDAVSVATPEIVIKTVASLEPVLSRVVTINGDFSSVFNGFAEGWTPETAEGTVAYDPAVGRAAAGSLRLTPHGGEGSVVAKLFALERTGKYRLTVWIRSKQANGQFIITVRYRSRQNESFTAPDTVERTSVTGDQPWRQLLLEIPVGRTDSSAEIHLSFKGSGTVWVDDFYVERPN